MHTSRPEQYSAAVLNRGRVVLTGVLRVSRPRLADVGNSEGVGTLTEKSTEQGCPKSNTLTQKSTEQGCPNSNCLQGVIFSRILTVPQLVNKFVAFYVTRKVISAFTKSHPGPCSMSRQLVSKSFRGYGSNEDSRLWSKQQRSTAVRTRWADHATSLYPQ
jgi:hypothetical protein